MEPENRVQETEIHDKQSKKILEKDSIQFNRQDLDQEQNVDLNPRQVNTQNIHIFIGENNFTGKITGTCYNKKSKKTLSDVKVSLFFGSEKKHAVHEVCSDLNGNFAFEDIPSGYYTLFARYQDLEYRSHYIKVLAGQTLHQSLLLENMQF